MNDKTISAETDDAIIQWLTFALGNEVFAIKVLCVQEMLRPTKISTVPGAPAHVVGIINLRGEVVTVNNMRTMLGLTTTENTDNTRIVLIELEDQKQGLLVDSLGEMIDVSPSEIESNSMSGEARQIIRGACLKKGELYTLLSIHELLRDCGTA